MQAQTPFPQEASVLSADDLQKVLFVRFGLEVRLCRLSYRSIHDSYLVRTDSGEYYLKIYRQGLRTKQDIAEEINCLLHLRGRGLSAVLPQVDKEGSYILEFAGLTGSRYGVLFQSVGENAFPWPAEDEQYCEKMGVYMGSLHRALDSFRENFCRPETDMECLQKAMAHIHAFAQLYEFDAAFLSQLAEKTLSILTPLSKTRPQYGYCHNDAYSGNIRLDGSDRPVLFDFDLCGKGYRAYDLSLFALPIELCENGDHKDKIERRLDSLLKGYSHYRSLSTQEMTAMPAFVAYRRIFCIGSVYIAMANTWGDQTALMGVREDIEKLKKWNTNIGFL